jgi:glycosyltransferase involved in cell wall biosynthesis
MYKNYVDVVIPAFNAEKFLRKSVESVINQGEVVNSIILVDDGSNDGTFSLMETLKSENPKFNFKILKKKNGGIGSARNYGIEHSDAKFIAFLDSDDEWHPLKLRSQLDKFKQHDGTASNIGLVYCGYKCIQKSNLNNFPGVQLNDLKPQYRGKFNKKIINFNCISGSGSTVLIKKLVFDRGLRFDESLNYAEDWDLWIQIAKEWEIDYCEEQLVVINHYKMIDKKTDQSFNDWISGTSDLLLKIEKSEGSLPFKTIFHWLISGWGFRQFDDDMWKHKINSFGMVTQAKIILTQKLLTIAQRFKRISHLCLLKLIYVMTNIIGINLLILKSSILNIYPYLKNLYIFRSGYFGALELEPRLHDRGGNANGIDLTYFYQDLFLAAKVNKMNPSRHIDVGSRLDGYIAHIAAFRPIEIIDVRPTTINYPNIKQHQLDFTNSDAIGKFIDLNGQYDSISCLHSIEHFGLGRYGDPVGSEKYKIAFCGFKKMLSPGGLLYISTPIGRRRVVFDAQRVFDEMDLIKLAMEHSLELVNFYKLHPNGNFEEILLKDKKDLCAEKKSFMNDSLGIYIFSH